MGLRGRAPESKRALEVKGCWKAKGRSPDLELEPGKPQPPELAAEAQAEWDRIVPILYDKSVLAEIDRAGLTYVCEAWAIYRALGEQSKNFELGSMDWRRVVSTQHEAFNRWEKMSTKFGLTPADRPRIRVPASTAKGDDKEQFFRPKIVS